MTTVVMNTLNLAVTEHDLPFHSVAGAHAGGDAGLFAHGGATDGGAQINAEFVACETLMGDASKKLASALYFSMTGTGIGEALVRGRSGQWSYPFPLRASGESRAVLGRGIRENYLSIGFKNTAGGDFRIDLMEFRHLPSNNRRI